VCCVLLHCIANVVNTGRFVVGSVQAGCLDDATELALRSLQMVQSQSGAVEDLSTRNMYLYGHLAHIETQV